jgi:hypothetical protein
LVSIKDLLESTYSVEITKEKGANTRHPSYVFSHKTFGHVYASNKTVIYKPNYNIIEMNMIIGSSTEKGRSAHRVSIALSGIKHEEYTTSELIALVRSENKKIGEEEDDTFILNAILNESKLLKNKVILQKDTNKNKFIVFSSHIPLTAEIRTMCSCSDYFYTFAWYNSDHNCLIGRRPPKYISYTTLSGKEKKSLVPVRNPRKKMGVCKHLLLFLALLMNGKVITESKPITSSFNKSFPEDLIMTRKDISVLLNSLKGELDKVKKRKKLTKISS